MYWLQLLQFFFLHNLKGAKNKVAVECTFQVYHTLKIFLLRQLHCEVYIVFWLATVQGLACALQVQTLSSQRKMIQTKNFPKDGSNH